MTSVSLDDVPDPTNVSGTELKKSRVTRRRILDSATALLAECGYQGFSTGAVSMRAGLTRPAMLYHFHGRAQLLAATVNHIVRRRIEIFEETVQSLAAEARNGSAEGAAKAVQANWAHLQSVEYLAFSELAMSARTRPELAEVLQPALEAFDRARVELVEEMPGVDLRQFLRMFDIVSSIAEGASLPGRLAVNHDARAAGVRDFIGYLMLSEEGRVFLEAAEKAGALPPPVSAKS